MTEASVVVETATQQEGCELFRRVCRSELGLEPEEFVRRLRAGECNLDDMPHAALTKLVLLIPFWCPLG